MSEAVGINGFQNDSIAGRGISGHEVGSVISQARKIGLDDVDGGIGLVKFQINKAVGQDQMMILVGKGRSGGGRRECWSQQSGEQDGETVKMGGGIWHVFAYNSMQSER